MHRLQYVIMCPECYSRLQPLYRAHFADDGADEFGVHLDADLADDFGDANDGNSRPPDIQ